MESDIIARIDKELSDCETAGWEDVPFPEELLMECKEEIIAASSRWIPVDERLPEEDRPVLVWMPDLPHAEHGTDIGYYIKSSWGVDWMVSGGRSAFPSHWMPLPEPPLPSPPVSRPPETRNSLRR